MFISFQIIKGDIKSASNFTIIMVIIQASICLESLNYFCFQADGLRLDFFFINDMDVLWRMPIQFLRSIRWIIINNYYFFLVQAFVLKELGWVQ
jgi:hypothetical protein